MTAENFDTLFDRLLSRRPFQVFTVELHGGKRFEIDAPHVTVYRDGFAIFLAPGKIPIYFDHESVSQVIDAPVNRLDDSSPGTPNP